MAKTGTLLLTWVDRSGLLTELRHRMRATFPGASTKQVCPPAPRADRGWWMHALGPARARVAPATDAGLQMGQ